MTITARMLWASGLALSLQAWTLAAQAQAQAPASPAATSAAPSKPARKATAARAGCSVAEFRTLGLDTHAPIDRVALATQWLLKNGPSCNEDQIAMIRANRALWLGVADTVAIMGLVDRIVEAKQSGRSDSLQSLYAPPTPERASALDVQRVNGGLRPVVLPPAPLPPLVLGAQVQTPGTTPAPGVPGMPGGPGAAPAAMP